MRDRYVGLIGVGMGAAAASAIKSGCRKVVGLERLTDLPLEEHRFLSYQPPMVARLSAGHRFRLSSSSLLTTGDFYNANTIHEFVQELPANALIIIDLESGIKDPGLDLIDKFRGTNYSLLVRTFLDDYQLGSVIADLKVSRCKVKIYRSDLPGDNEVLLLLPNGVPSILKIADVPSAVKRPDRPSMAKCSWAGRGITDVLIELAGREELESSESLEEWRACIQQIVKATSATRLARVRYEEWTILVNKLWLFDMASEPPEKVCDCLRDLSPGDMVTSSTGHTVQLLRSSYSHLHKTIPRLWTAADRYRLKSTYL